MRTASDTIASCGIAPSATQPHTTCYSPHPPHTFEHQHRQVRRLEAQLVGSREARQTGTDDEHVDGRSGGGGGGRHSAAAGRSAQQTALMSIQDKASKQASKRSSSFRLMRGGKKQRQMELQQVL